MITNKTARDFIIASKLFKGRQERTEVTVSGAIATFECNNTIPCKAVTCDINPSQSGSGDPSPVNPRPLSGVSTLVITQKDDLENPTKSKNYDVALGQTVYGGIFNCNTGVLTVMWKSLTLNGSESWNASGNCKFIEVEDCLIANDYGNGLCSIFSNFTTWANVTTTTNTGDYTIYKHSTWTKSRIGFNGQDMTTTDFKTWLSNNNIQIVYELATPIEVQLTPEEVTPYEGVNNIYHNGNGDISVTYYNVTGEGDNKIKYLPLIYGKKYYRKEY